MEPIKQDKTEQSEPAHSNFKKNLNDYNDGANVTHHLGNDDYSGNNLDEPTENEDNPMLEGKVAYGNDVTQDDTEDENSDDSES